MDTPRCLKMYPVYRIIFDHLSYEDVLNYLIAFDIKDNLQNYLREKSYGFDEHIFDHLKYLDFNYPGKGIKIVSFSKPYKSLIEVRICKKYRDMKEFGDSVLYACNDIENVKKYINDKYSNEEYDIVFNRVRDFYVYYVNHKIKELSFYRSQLIKIEYIGALFGSIRQNEKLMADGVNYKGVHYRIKKIILKTTGCYYDN